MVRFAEKKIQMPATGYSGTPLAKKLGIKENYIIRLINAPQYYFQLFTDFPANVKVVTDTKSKKDFIHYFAVQAETLQKDILSLKNQIQMNGIIWISWYKKSAKMPSDITEDFIRQLALRNGMVDIKVCAVDEMWSGLKLVIPVKERK